MNKNSKNSYGVKSVWLGIKTSSLICGVLIATASLATAQNQFAPRSNYQPDLGNWTPPNTAGSVYRNNSGFPAAPTSPPSSVSFPESITPFETGIRTATYDTPAPDLATDPTITDRIDGAAATLSKWKDLAGEKASTLLGGVKQDGNWLDKIQTFIKTSDIGKMLGSLALVLGLYFGFVWFMQKFNLGRSSGLPSEVVEALGQVPFGSRRSLQLVRLGSKVLLLLNSPEGTQPLGEIADPHEVEHLVSLCQSKRGSQFRRATPAAEQVATRLAGQPAQPTGNVGATNLNDVVRILQQAANPQRAVFEA